MKKRQTFLFEFFLFLFFFFWRTKGSQMKKKTKEEAIEKDPVVLKNARRSCWSYSFFIFFLRTNGSKMKKRTKEEAIRIEKDPVVYPDVWLSVRCGVIRYLFVQVRSDKTFQRFEVYERSFPEGQSLLMQMFTETAGDQQLTQTGL